jgi:hypothetical protein
MIKHKFKLNYTLYLYKIINKVTKMATKKDFYDPEKEATLNALKEEYNYIQSKKNIVKDHTEIIKE